MQIVSIDFFTVPEESKVAFREESHKVQEIVKGIPGLLEAYAYELMNGDSSYNFMSSAVWESKEAFEAAGKVIWESFQKQGFNPQEVFAKLGVTRMRSEYTREAY